MLLQAGNQKRQQSAHRLSASQSNEIRRTVERRSADASRVLGRMRQHPLVAPTALRCPRSRNCPYHQYNELGLRKASLVAATATTVCSQDVRCSGYIRTSCSRRGLGGQEKQTACSLASAGAAVGAWKKPAAKPRSHLRNPPAN